MEEIAVQTEFKIVTVYLDEILTNIWRQIDFKVPARLGENDLLHFQNMLYKISSVEILVKNKYQNYCETTVTNMSYFVLRLWNKIKRQGKFIYLMYKFDV